MARSAYDDPGASSRVSAGSVSSWKSLFWIALGAAGVGFAGYVYLVPYQKMQSRVGSHQSELAAEHGTATSAVAERERLKADLARMTAAEQEKQDQESKRKATIDALASGLKPGLEALGATITVDPDTVLVSFSAAKLIDRNGIDVSDNGVTMLKILAGAARKEGATIRVRARASAAPPPRELRALFHTAGEMNAVRAARIMSSLENAGLAPTRVGIVGQPGLPVTRTPRGRRAPPAPGTDRVELELQPE